MLDNTHRVADIPMRAWNKLLWKMSMTLWIERRSSRSSVHCSLDRYSSSSTRARCASGRQQGKSMNHITTSYDEKHTAQISSSSQPAQRFSRSQSVSPETRRVAVFDNLNWSLAHGGAASTIRARQGRRLFSVPPLCDVTQTSTLQHLQVPDAVAVDLRWPWTMTADFLLHWECHQLSNITVSSLACSYDSFSDAFSVWVFESLSGPEWLSTQYNKALKLHTCGLVRTEDWLWCCQLNHLEHHLYECSWYYFQY